MNKSHDYRALEREYITSQISLRELCRRHNITAHSLVTVQAKKHRWEEKREAYRAQETDSFIGKHADRMADRQAEISDRALDAITKFRQDMSATTLVRQPDGSYAEEPAWRMKPKDFAVLIDRFEVLFGKPSVISQHQGLSSPRSCLLMPCATSSRRRGAREGHPRWRSHRCHDDSTTDHSRWTGVGVGAIISRRNLREDGPPAGGEGDHHDAAFALRRCWRALRGLWPRRRA